MVLLSLGLSHRGLALSPHVVHFTFKYLNNVLNTQLFEYMMFKC